ncbi:hypothetical protein M5689_001466 [Euphorbia peplus]|nr:hypothetical protein M5689_001466 [Euphorbia peplus]
MGILGTGNEIPTGKGNYIDSAPTFGDKSIPTTWVIFPRRFPIHEDMDPKWEQIITAIQILLPISVPNLHTQLDVSFHFSHANSFPAQFT